MSMFSMMLEDAERWFNERVELVRKAIFTTSWRSANDRPRGCVSIRALYCLDRLQKNPRTVSARASSALKKERHDDGRETITTGSNYHLARINQPALNEKRALTAGGQGSYRSPGKGKHLGELR